MFIASFNVLGSPGSLLQVALPASTPLFARRKSLLAVSSSATPTGSDNILNLVSTLSVASGPLRRLLSLRLPLLYQKLLSTVPLSVTLNTVLPNSSIAIVSLDGRIDWVANTKGSAELLAYSPLQASSLSVTSHRHGSVITGRGIVALTGTSPNIFKVALAQGESFLVARSALLAYSLDDPKTRHPEPERIAAVLESEEKTPAQPSTASFISQAAIRLSSWGTSLVNLLRSDTTPFVRMHGPSTLLLQSSSSTPLFPENTGSVLSSLLPGSQRSLESEIAAQLIAKHVEQTTTSRGSHPKDYLKIATIGPEGKVTFESTSSFKNF